MISRQQSTRILKGALTLLLAVLAAFTLWHLYVYYTYAPQTRDGKVRADIVPLASDVSGRVDEVFIHDNQAVRRGQVLFTIDRARLANNVEQTDAAVATAQAQMAAAEHEDKRYRALADVVASQELDVRRSAAEQARAQYAQAVADRNLARINLQRAQVRAPVNGIVTNFALRPGTYATAGQPVMAIVDSDSFYIAGYFEETKLSHIQVGMRATIHIMGEKQTITGHVQGMSAGIEDRERTTASGSLLANVNPTFSWVRLAQRIPVRIAIDHVPQGMTLIAGRTATVTVDESSQAPASGSPR